MAKKIFGITTQPGIRRDGTIMDGNQFSDGEWVRFQRGRPRKILGYREITPNLNTPSRGMYLDSQNTVSRIFNGYEAGVQIITIDKNGVGADNDQAQFGGIILTLNTLVGGSLYTNGTYSGVALTGGTGSSATANIVVSGNAVTTVTLVSGGNGYLVGDTLSATAATIGGTGSGFSIKVATINDGFTASEDHLWQFDEMYDTSGASSVLIAHPGHNLEAIDNTVDSPVLIANVSGNPEEYVFRPVTDAGTPVEVSGGAVSIHPYLFVYGNNGYIANSTAGDPFDWSGTDANAVNVAASKIVKGFAIRGGTTAPSGLFWALDSLIRVSFVGAPLYWRYDIIGQSTILSSSSVVEYDGVYYWCGVDRFLMYNGVIKEVPNGMNQNWFFDNLNYNQRQKVWGTKVPRYGEIWWFYPRGDATECNDVIIYNVRENTWYDTGSAPGSRRSAGYYTQVFPFPVMGDTTPERLGVVLALGAITGGSGYTNGTYQNVTLTGGTGSGARANITVSGNAVTDVSLIYGGEGYEANDTLSADSADIGGGSSFEVIVSTVVNVGALWQHEIGLDEIKGQNQNAIRSSFTTNNLGWITGNPSQPSPVGDNRWMRIERIEPDFLQEEEMSVYVTGKSYAQGTTETSDAYPFNPNTPKIDIRQQRRELQLIFESNVVRGNYQMGNVIVHADIGDVRGNAE